MMSTALRLMVCASWAVAASAAQAQTSYFGGAEARASSFYWLSETYSEQRPDPVLSVLSTAVPIAAAADNLAAAGPGQGTSHGSYRLNPGGLHLLATATALAQGGEFANNGSWAESRVSAVFGDVFVLDVPNAAPGSVYRVQARIDLSGAAYGNGQASVSDHGSGGYASIATWSAQAALYNSHGSFAIAASAFCRHDLGYQPTCGGDAFGSFVLDFTATVGQPNQLYLMGDLRAEASSTYSADFGVAVASAGADLGRTIAWGGLLSVSDAANQSVVGFSALSASSGFDYRNAYAAPVPEPAAWISLALGLLALGLRKAQLTA